MNSRVVPRAATWLLERVGDRSRLDPLIGDLIEQFEEGRSRLWYWRQAVGSVSIELARRIRLDGLSFIAAVAVGWALIWLLDAGYPIALQMLRASFAASSQYPSLQAVPRAASGVICDLVANALTFMAVWVVVRIHRPHPRAVLSALAAVAAVRFLPEFARFVFHAATDPQFAAPLVLRHLDLMVPVVWQALFILAAGLWLVRKHIRTGMRRWTYFVAALVVVQYGLAELARAEGLAGEVTDMPYARYIVDVLSIGGVGYLVLLLWRPTLPPGMISYSPTHSGRGVGQ